MLLHETMIGMYGVQNRSNDNQLPASNACVPEYKFCAAKGWP